MAEARSATAEDSRARYELAGTDALLAEPSFAENLPAPRGPVSKIIQQWPRLYSMLEQRLGGLRLARLPYLQHWAMISQYTQPRRSTWQTEGGLDFPVPNSARRGAPINQSILDPTGTYAADVCAAGMFSGNMSPTRPWFLLATRDDQISADGAWWLDFVSNEINYTMARSNLYQSAAQLCYDTTYFGTAVSLIYEDQDSLINASNCMIGEFFLANDGAQRPTTLYRTFTLSAAQIVDRYGAENCPEDVRTAWQEKGAQTEREFIVIHCIEPNVAIRDGATGNDIGVVPGGFSYREFYWVWGQSTKYPLSVRGFREVPFIASRWQVNSNDPYGWAPSMTVLPDVMQLQQETRRKAELLEKIVRPPMNAPLDLKNMPSSVQPGGINYTSNPQLGMSPVFQVHPQAFQAITEDLNELRVRIKQGFYNDLFLMAVQSQKDETAYEVAAKQQEKLQMLGPVIERFQNEVCSQIIGRVYSILKRKGRIPPPPQSMRGVPVELRFISMLALAQRAAQTAGIERLLGVSTKLAPFYPESLDVVDPIKALKTYASDLGVNRTIMRSNDQIQQRGQQRAKAQQAAQQQQAAESMGQHIPKLAQAAQNMSGIDVGGGISAFNAMMGNATPTLPNAA